MRNFTINFLKKSLSLTGFLGVVVLWSIFSRIFNSFVLPSPLEVVESFVDIIVTGQLLRNFLITFKRTLVGFTFAFLGGMGVSFLMKKSSIFRKIFQPLVTFIQTTPPVVWLVLAIIWFGIAQDLTPMFVIFIVVFPIVLINLLEGLDSFDVELVQMAKVFNTGEGRVFLHVLLPGLSPYIVSSVRVGLAFAWKSTVLAEFLSSSSGVGYMLSTANSLLDTSGVFAWSLVLVLTMLGLECLIINPVRRKVNLWVQET